MSAPRTPFVAWRVAPAELSSAEFGAAGLLGGLAAATVAVGKVLPHVGVLELLATIPFAVLAVQHRARAVVTGAIAGATVALLLVGLGGLLTVCGCALIGGAVGWVKARRRGGWTVLGCALVLGPLVGIAADAVLVLFAPLRELALGSVTHLAAGVTVALHGIPVLSPAAEYLRGVIDLLVGTWWVWVPVAATIAAVGGMLVTWRLLIAAVARLAPDRADGIGGRTREAEWPPPAPLPVSLNAIEVHYPSASAPALAIERLDISPGSFVVVTGANGSGKSTLLHALAGAPVTRGRVERPGPIGLGRVGGTALVLQRPETQVLGMTVTEDLAWGLPDGHPLDVPAALAEVGLSGLEHRSTSALSGGQLQRLAIAAAIVRRPALLLSDESTAMVDSAGRDGIIGLLAGLPRRHGITVVHVTHFEAEARQADRHIVLAAGRVVRDAPPAAPDRPTRPVERGPAPQPDSPAVLEARDLSYTYAPGTPWAHRALRNVSMEVAAGEGVRVEGGNGSGKSTLAWLLAGLLVPSSGTCTLDGRPVDQQVGAVSIAFQHSRLQVQRPTVDAEIASAAARGFASEAERVEFAQRALALVDLDPALARRPVDALSGGQLKRVALAGILVRRPRALILDEPFAGLDPASRDALVETLLRIREAQAMAIVLITHDVVGADRLCPRVISLRQGILR
ncbi:MAG TPA: ATP-binding cassette domain-containing protein [Amnibacterium sp.]|jgi:energy-coupling factor transport system ATP-binding protein|uniref:ABC transporter ATP-binding protein n=1 Tax=Amnibacterium sp. TaxID=1872496 RepID=UPI002F952D69